MTTHLYVGCYTTSSPVGIHVFEISDGGAASVLGTDSTVVQASFLTVRPDTATLYVVRETADTGAVVAMRIGNDGLTTIDEVPSHGSAPCHVSSAGDHLFVANYASGNVGAYALQPDGRFGEQIGVHRHRGSGPHPRQDAPHAHCMVPDPGGTSVYATDLGTDRIMRYVLDGNGLRCADDTPMQPGSGPRHLAFHPSRPLAFVLCELDSTLVVADVDRSTGHLHPRTAVSTLPGRVDGDSIAAEVAVHPDGSRVYVSNRGHDSIATFAVDAAGGPPELLGHVPSGGRTPRHFAIHPSGRLLLAANQDTGTIVSFELDDHSGVPQQIGVAAEVSQPVCLTFVEVDR